MTQTQKNDAEFVNPEQDLRAMMNRIEQLEDVVNQLGFSNKVVKKKRFRNKRQPNVLYGLSRAFCVETIDPLKENRVRFYHPIIHDPQSELFSLPFASPVSNMGGFDDCGMNWVPPAGSTLIVFFEGGSTDAPFYLGTTWHRDRGSGGSMIEGLFPATREYQNIYRGHRRGYLVGPDDESQVFPPWNTESSNGSDIDDFTQFRQDPEEQQRITYPNIYGFKTPEKHMVKMVDGDAKCNRRWKRFELMSGCGNWMILKDDHLHYAGQWAHPECPPDPGGGPLDICAINSQDAYFTDIQGTPIEKQSMCDPGCSTTAGKQCSSILGGHSSYPSQEDPTKTQELQHGSNPFFKHKNECRPYKGPGTPQNNKCQLPQSGIQLLSIGGHTMVMDDSVEEPYGKPTWERSMESFNFGCSDKCLGVFWIKSMTGHSFVMSDVEKETKLRGDKNYIQLKTATGNLIEMNDDTIGTSKDCECPPNLAGPKRGITMQSTSNHVIKMIDYLNEQCSPCRKEGGEPKSKATQAYIQIKSGYGLEMKFSDDHSQEQTQQQWIQITHPQCVDPNTDEQCNDCDSAECRGPHFLRFQGRPRGTPGVVFLRAGGHAIRQTYDMDIVLVGDKEKNPSDKFTYVSKKRISSTEDIDFRYSGEQHIFFAEKKILLMAGRDCPPKEEGGCKGPCLYSVIVSRCPVICNLTGILHWTEKAMSQRVFASAYHPCQGPSCAGCDKSSYDSQMAAAKDPPCDASPTQSIDTGNGTVTIGGQSSPSSPDPITSPPEHVG
jgi:hypothetical protein